jgi:hypothetical protein
MTVEYGPIYSEDLTAAAQSAELKSRRWSTAVAMMQALLSNRVAMAEFIEEYSGRPHLVDAAVAVRACELADNLLVALEKTELSPFCSVKNFQAMAQVPVVQPKTPRALSASQPE